VPVLCTPNFPQPQIPVSAPIQGYPGNETRATTYCGTEPNTGSPQSQFFFRTEDLNGWQMDNVLSMADNPHQSYGYVTNHQGTHDLILPPRSLGVDDNPSRHHFSDAAQYSTPHRITPYDPYMPLPTNMPRYVETSTGSFYLTMTSNDGTDFAFGPFPNDDARNNHNPYLG